MDIEERNEKPSNTGVVLHSAGRLRPIGLAINVRERASVS